MGPDARGRKGTVVGDFSPLFAPLVLRSGVNAVGVDPGVDLVCVAAAVVEHLAVLAVWQGAAGLRGQDALVAHTAVGI